MFNLLSSFLAGFLSTAFLFVISVIIALGIKTLDLLIKELAEEKPSPESKPKKARRKKRRKTTAPQRSIEIDPSQIDRIYVKKSS